MSDGHRIENPHDARDFLLAGNATVTLVSKRTGARFTFKVRKPKDDPNQPQRGNVAYFVSLMVGPDNEGDFQYLGLVRSTPGGLRYERGKKSRISDQAPSAKAFAWVWQMLVGKGIMPEQLEVWHEGHCGRCGRPLTVPESIATGFGPECSARLGIERVSLRAELPKERRPHREPVVPRRRETNVVPTDRPDIAYTADEVERLHQSIESYQPPRGLEHWAGQTLDDPLDDLFEAARRKS